MDKIISKVLSKFGVRPQKWTIIKQSSDRAVWEVEGEQGKFILKSITAQKAKIISNITPYLLEKGIPVIPVLPALNGDFVVHSKKYSYILFPWFEGKRIHYESPETIKRMSSLLAQFHEASRGYASTGRPITNSRFDLRDKFYKKKKKLEDIYNNLSSNDERFLKVVSQHYVWLLNRCNWAINEFSRSSYKSFLKSATLDPILGHGDYSKANILTDNSGNWRIIDLDTAGILLPVYDISRMITWINHDLGNWDGARYQLILESYRSIRPFSKEEEEILIVDQCFPHLVISMMDRYIRRKGGITIEEIEKCLETDKEKIRQLSIKKLEWYNPNSLPLGNDDVVKRKG